MLPLKTQFSHCTGAAETMPAAVENPELPARVGFFLGKCYQTTAAKELLSERGNSGKVKPQIL